jgi:hypothetical protein
MRIRQCIPNARTVHKDAAELIKEILPWKDFRDSMTIADILRLLLLLSTMNRTLSHIVRFFFIISHETARRAIQSQLKDQAALTQGLVRTLYKAAEFSRRDRRRKWVLAIDENKVPFYGDRKTKGIQGGQKKHGTNHFYTYATATLIHHRRRYVVGLIAITESMKPHEIVSALLNQVFQHGLQVRGVVLDSGFESGDTLLLLQKKGLSYTVPLRRKGNKKNARNQLFDLPTGTVRDVSWTTDQTRKKVSTETLVWKHKHTKEVKVFAFGGWDENEARSQQQRAWLSRRYYRKRFGIETSYRQKNQSRGWTTSKSICYRLLLEGLAYLIRQMWVTVTRKIAEAKGLRPTEWVEDLMLVDLCDLIMMNFRIELREEEDNRVP